MLILAMNEDKLTVCYKQWPIQSWFTDGSSDFQHSYISLPEGKPLHPLSKWCNQQDNTWQYQNPPARNRRKSKHLKAHPEKKQKTHFWSTRMPIGKFKKSSCHGHGLHQFHQFPRPWPQACFGPAPATTPDVPNPSKDLEPVPACRYDVVIVHRTLHDLETIAK